MAKSIPGKSHPGKSIPGKSSPGKSTPRLPRQGGQKKDALVQHGAYELPSVIVDSYNLELRDREGFIGDRASKRAFAEKLEDWRERVRKIDEDPLGKVPTSKLTKKELDELLATGNGEAASLIFTAIEEFAQELAGVIRRFLRAKGWQDTECIVVGGGFKESRVGELAIARSGVLLKADGIAIRLMPIRHHPDEAGLIGVAHLMPAWMLAGHDGILAVDIGGTNIRAGVVLMGLKDAADLSRAEVWRSDHWRHADDEPNREEAVKHLARMLSGLIAKAGKENLTLAPVIGIGCPGLIEADGSIARGGQNLPGGNWDSSRFNLPKSILEAIPTIDGQETFVVMHNDAVVQGLSQVPFMQDIRHWGVVTIGTGLGNARYTNKSRQ
jgi:predicted NBD/HSP70 family sugar kinase